MVLRDPDKVLAKDRVSVVQIADLNRDGKPDLVVGDRTVSPNRRITAA